MLGTADTEAGADRRDTSFTESLTAAAAIVSPEEAGLLAKTHFGIAGSAQMLKGERDQNFWIDSAHGTYLLKISHPAEDRNVTDFHTRALLHMESADPDLPVPRILRAHDGRPQCEFRDAEGMARTARLMSFLPGTMAANVLLTRRFRTALGAILARLDQAMANFHHPADDHPLLWDLKQAGKLTSLVPDVADRTNRANASRALANFEDSVVPKMPALRAQVIHNDLTPFNVLVDESDSSRITGVLDFGDMVRAPLVNDIAIAVSYHVGGDRDLLAPVLEIVHAYNALVPLTQDECDILGDLIATRLATTILITEWRAKHHPENREYILKNHPAAAAGLAGLCTLSREEVQAAFRAACGLEH